MAFVWLLLERVQIGSDGGGRLLKHRGGNGIYSVDGATPSDGRKRLSVATQPRNALTSG
jgi:hypothetical protein